MSDGRSRDSQCWDEIFESETGLEEESMGSWKSSHRYPHSVSSGGAGGGRSRSGLLEPSANEEGRQTTSTRRHPARGLEQENDDWYDHQQDRHHVPRANRSGLQDPSRAHDHRQPRQQYHERPPPDGIEGRQQLQLAQPTRGREYRPSFQPQHRNRGLLDHASEETSANMERRDHAPPSVVRPQGSAPPTDPRRRRLRPQPRKADVSPTASSASG
ncbi:unnamed protein product, partial [Ectocarpus sp. 12 AP-2014]